MKNNKVVTHDGWFYRKVNDRLVIKFSGVEVKLHESEQASINCRVERDIVTVKGPNQTCVKFELSEPIKNMQSWRRYLKRSREKSMFIANMVLMAWRLSGRRLTLTVAL